MECDILNRSRCNWHILFLLLLLVASTTARAQITNKTPPAEPSVAKTLDLDRDTQTIAFMGDSITHMGEYHQYVQTFFATRYPGHDLWTVNLGWSGGTARHGLQLLQWDVYDGLYKPDVVFVHWGMNDVGSLGLRERTTPPTDESLQKRRDQYKKRMREVIGTLQKNGTRVIVLSPTPFDDAVDLPNSPGGQSPIVPEELAKYGDFAKAIAEEMCVPFIDVHAPMRAVNRQKQAIDSKDSLIRDRVHPDKAGHLMMMHIIMKDAKACDLVYDVTIDAAKPRLVSTKQAELKQISKTDGTLRFSLRESALPFPAPKLNRGLHPLASPVDVAAQWNRQRLTIQNLAKQQYRLCVDGVEVGKFSSEELAQGIDLGGMEKTPQYQEALKLQELIYDRKASLEKDVRAMAVKGQEGWFDGPIDEEQKQIDQQIREYQSKDRLRGWTSYILKTASDAFGRREQIFAELREIRKTLAERPEQTVYRYELSPVSASE